MSGTDHRYQRNSRLESLYSALSLEYEKLKIKLEELEAEKMTLIEHMLYYRANRQLVITGSLERTRDWSSADEEMKVYFRAGEQEVNLNCAFLSENKRNEYICHWDFGNEPLVSCVGCANPTVFVKSQKCISSPIPPASPSH
ncbi:MAG: hypothetical protein ACFFD4_29300 [Candidatus Odinarchaeota archaeon]